MTMGVFDFKSIRRSLEHQEQKADFEEKNPKPVDAAPVVWTPDWGYGVAAPLTSLAHPEWPYTGTSFEWPKLKI